jgi:uncharacterized protein (TIGR02466 family)
MKDLMEITNFFATPIGAVKISKDLCLKITNEIKKLSEQGLKDIDSNGFSECTEDNLHLMEEFSELVSDVNKHVKVYSEEVVGIKFEDLTLTTMWSNLHKNGGKHHIHQHPNSFISGVIYLQIPKESTNVGRILFVDPRVQKNMFFADFVKETFLSDRNVWYHPEEELMLLFPSWLEHGTDVFLCPSQERRIALSFNYMLNKNTSKNTMRFNCN